jgi:hypothetical protein
MIWVVLATGLGAHCIVFVLLFRRLRGDLNRQLRDMRAEHNSEWILRALRDAPGRAVVQAANGRGHEPPPMGPQPVRRKRHLGLFLGGGVAALLTTTRSARDRRRSHRRQFATTAAAAAVTATTIALVILSPWEDDSNDGPPSSAPTAGPTASLTPSEPPSGSSALPSRSGPAGGDGPEPDGSASTPTTTPMVPIDEMSGATGPHGQPEEPPPAGGEPSPGSPTSGAPPPAESPPQETPPGEPPTEQPPMPPPPGLCIRLVVGLVLDLDACIFGGGG